MSRKIPIIVSMVGIALLAVGIWGASGQDGGEGDFPETVIRTSANNVVGIGDYVAAEAYGLEAGEDPAEEPAQAIIFPYGIYPNMHVEVIEDFVQPEPAVEGFTFAWTLVAPEGSSAELTEGTVAIFRADVEGRYELTLAITDPNGNEAETTWIVDATTYVGSGYLDGPESAEDQCIDCHDDVAADWMATGHADAFAEGIDGISSDHFQARCVECHSTGFNNREGAENGGFDDIAAEAGWTFPEEVTAGNWEEVLANYPEVAAMANVQCEACHGPGYLHVFEGSRRDSMISTGLDYGTCAQCHAEEPYHTIPQQWENSAHSDKNARAFWYPVGEGRESCVACHSGYAYIDKAAGEEELRTDYQTITCAVCHDPHDANNPNQLRVFDSVTLPDGTEVAAAGPAATCMSCHNARRHADAIVDGAVAGENFSTPHYSTGGELMNATGGYTWGEDLPTSTHGRAVEGSCIGCHMAETPGMDADGAPLAGHNTVGGHTFAMSDAEGNQNVAVCQVCHDYANAFEFDARGDYDGDGTIESNQAEVEGLREVLEAAIVEAGVGVLDHHPYFEVPESSDENLYGAVWNLKFTESGGSAIHNLRYTVSLLQLSYERLTGAPLENAYILPPK